MVECQWRERLEAKVAGAMTTPLFRDLISTCTFLLPSVLHPSKQETVWELKDTLQLNTLKGCAKQGQWRVCSGGVPRARQRELKGHIWYPDLTFSILVVTSGLNGLMAL